MANNNDKGHPIIEHKGRFALFISLCVVILIMAIICFCFPHSNTNDSTDYNNQATPAYKKDSLSKSKTDSTLGYPKHQMNLRTDEGYDKDRADNDEDYDPYDNPDRDESTHGESRPEYFIRGNIPDPELYPEDVVKEWVKEHGTEDEIRDVEEGRY